MFSKKPGVFISVLSICLLAYPVCAGFCPAAAPCCEEGCGGCEFALPDCQRDINRSETVTLEPPVFVCLVVVKVEAIFKQTFYCQLELSLPLASLAIGFKSHPHTGPPIA